MILILAGKHDQPARRLLEMWRGRARLVTPGDLSRAGWCHRSGDPGADVAVASGERIQVAAIEGVLSRIPGIAPEELAHVAEPDRAYVAAELTAFLLAWLAALPCPVLNRPVPSGLMGAPHGPEGWATLAARVGLRPAIATRRYPAPVEDAWPAGAITVAVLGERCFGEVDPALAAQACRLAAAARVELLAVMFAGAGAGAAFAGANLWPDVSERALAAALLARLAGARERCA